jgi:hypothetical protein
VALLGVLRLLGAAGIRGVLPPLLMPLLLLGVEESSGECGLPRGASWLMGERGRGEPNGCGAAGGAERGLLSKSITSAGQQALQW